MSRIYDALIVGQGMAGLVLARLLREAGVEVGVLAPRRSGGGGGLKSVEKVSSGALALGETLPPATLGLLQRLGLRELFEAHAYRRTRGYHSIWGQAQRRDQHFFGQRPFDYGLKLRRGDLLEAMVMDLGEETCLDVRVVEVTWEGEELSARSQVKKGQTNGSREYIAKTGRSSSQARGHWVITIRQGKTLRILRSRILVDATGRKRAVLKKLGIASQALDQQLAFTCHLPGSMAEQLVHGVLVESFEQGWGMLSQLEADRLVMSLFTEKGNPERGAFAKLEGWRRLLAETTVLKGFLFDPLSWVTNADHDQFKNLSPAEKQIAGQNLNQGRIRTQAPIKTKGESPPLFIKGPIDPAIPKPVQDLAPRIRGGDANTSIPERVCGPGWLAIGDAAMAFDPLSSHGISNAVYTAWKAAEAIPAWLKGNGIKAFQTYGQNLGQIFAAWHQQKDALYRQENRWPDAWYWQLKQGKLTN